MEHDNGVEVGEEELRSGVDFICWKAQLLAKVDFSMVNLLGIHVARRRLVLGRWMFLGVMGGFRAVLPLINVNFCTATQDLDVFMDNKGLRNVLIAGKIAEQIDLDIEHPLRG